MPTKRIFLLLGLLALNSIYAQQKAKQKPIKLPVKGKNHEVSMEYQADIVYFTKTDLVLFMEKKDQKEKNKAHAENIRYLKANGKEIILKYTDTAFSNVAERNLHKAILDLTTEMLAEGRACDMAKATHVFVNMINAEPCEKYPQHFMIREKKGRVIFDCK